tara:strand:+ start:907 stop:1059 length:153 start_codon:yes stop_codon:yes gene_type:complete
MKHESTGVIVHDPEEEVGTQRIAGMSEEKTNPQKSEVDVIAGANGSKDNL